MAPTIPIIPVCKTHASYDVRFRYLSWRFNYKTDVWPEYTV